MIDTMASASCDHCGRVLEYSGERPRFCAYCGATLTASTVEATIAYTPEPSATVTQPPSPAADDEAPVDLPGYRLLRRLGAGGMGTVFEAEETAHGRRVAVKVLNARLGAGGDSIERFRQEGRLAGTIAHPRCVFVLAADEAEGRPYIVMELMTGATLQTLVERRGPRPVGEAVGLILDVIEGLAEAHRLGLVHRDVKPSNCFLEANGRVKVGDFGLSKTLGGDVRLTRTGAFIGTPLYASPEQIKGAPIDVRTDVYAVCATLYYLLTGSAPFDSKDAAATLARIVSEPIPSIRERRSSVPVALEAAIVRGMDRDRERRWRSLEDLRDALLPFAPRPIPAAAPSRRLAAFAIDLAIWAAVKELLSYVLAVLLLWPVAADLASVATWTLLFAPAEGIWGGSLGKRLLRLRVLRSHRRIEPGLLRSLGRCLTLYGLLFVPSMAARIVLAATIDLGPVLNEAAAVFAGIILFLVGMVLNIAPMRPQNGFRGLHEWVSGTRTVSLPRAARALRRSRWAGASRLPAESSWSSTGRPADAPERVGPFVVRGAIARQGDYRVLAAEDEALRRVVWVVLRPLDDGAPDESRRSLSRSTRVRWVAGGEQDGRRWDAFTAPAGIPLAEFVRPRGLAWVEARPILSALADELADARNDNTLPTPIRVDQVWIGPDGRIQLVEPLGPATTDEPDADRRALDFLAGVATLALGGKARRATAPRRPIRAAVPMHARALLDRLAGLSDRFDRVDDFREALAATEDQPTELPWVVRAVRILGFLAGAAIKLFVVGGIDWLIEGPHFGRAIAGASGLISDAAELIEVVSWALLTLPLLAAVTRAGLLPRLLGAVLVREDGRRPSRLRCAAREAIIWAPLLVLVVVAEVLSEELGLGVPTWLRVLVDVIPLLWPLADALHELADPGRMLHDRIARTRLVPR